MPDDSTLEGIARGLGIDVDRVRQAAARSLAGYVEPDSPPPPRPTNTHLTQEELAALDLVPKYLTAWQVVLESAANLYFESPEAARQSWVDIACEVADKLADQVLSQRAGPEARPVLQRLWSDKAHLEIHGFKGLVPEPAAPPVAAEPLPNQSEPPPRTTTTRVGTLDANLTQEPTVNRDQDRDKPA